MSETIPCPACDGTGDSGEVEIDEAPATWDDPGWREERPIPCERCRGTGTVPKPRQPTLDDAAFKSIPLDDETPF